MSHNLFRTKAELKKALKPLGESVRLPKQFLLDVIAEVESTYDAMTIKIEEPVKPKRKSRKK